MSRPVRGPGLVRLTLFNLLRKPGRSSTAVVAVMLAAATVFAGALIGTGVQHAVRVGMGRLGADLMVVPRGAVSATHTALVMGEPVAFYMDGAVAGQVAAVPGVKSVSGQTYVETLASAACCTGRLFLIGFDPATDLTVQPWLYRALGRNLAPDEILVGAHVLTAIPGTMKFFGTEFQVAGQLDPTGMGMDESVFLPAASVAAMAANSVTLAEKPLAIPPGAVSAVMVRLVDPTQDDAMAAKIAAAVPGVAAITGGQVSRGVTRDLANLMSWLLPIAGGVLLVAALLFGLLFSAITAERAREIGLLRAIGATQFQAVAALVGEAALLGAIGGLAGAGAGLGLYSLFQKALLVEFGLPFLWPDALQVAAMGVLVTAGAALLAAATAAWPARRIARLEPHFAIHARG
ncbi:MAG TPA: FtsX-like permease family protein [Symbiobacteriaceae bacterium]|jgi:putative ABC transport system permease protein